MGPTGPRGDKGDQGETGPTGPQGETGPTGPMPPKSMCLKSFLRSYNDIPGSVELEQPVLFNKNDIIVGTLAHVPGTGDFLLYSVGYYQVSGKIFHEFAIQIAGFLNGVLLQGSVIGEPATTSMIIIHDIIRVTEADLLPNANSPTGFAAVYQVRNHSSYITPILLDGRAGSGSDLTQVNASMVIIQICDEVEERPN
jgi:hypothetical protein